MAEIFVEQRGPQQYVALRCEAIVSIGTTEEDTAQRAHRLYPGDVVFGERGDVVFGKRIRTTTIGSRDKWTVIHHRSSLG